MAVLDGSSTAKRPVSRRAYPPAVRVAEVMHREVVTVPPETTCAKAAQTLRECGISSVIVSVGGGPLGILTERDFVTLVAAGLDPATVPVSERMSTELVTIAPSADLAEAAQLMAERGVRHLPVVDRGRLVGIVSIRDPVSRHPALRRVDEERRQSLQARVADAITTFAGSMTFVYVHVVWFGLWLLLRFEKFPFGLLTMVVSLEAIFLSTFVMISQNRADERRAALADHQWELVQQEEKQNEQLIELSEQILDLTKAIHDLTAATGPTP